LRWNINNTQFFTETISSVLKFSGQLSDSNLDSSQKFYLGGASGVRAYPTSEGSGSEGYLLSAALHKELSTNLTAIGFYDYGFARQYIDNTNNSTGLENATGKNSFNMKGYGTSIEWTGFVGSYRSTLSAIWSRRIGNNPNPQVDGTDSDGTKHSNFYWLKASIVF
jgi:hemolysin activation/secretion protein